MHPRCAASERDIGTIVHENGDVEYGHERTDHFHQRSCARIFEPDLHHRRTASDSRGRASAQSRDAATQVIGDRDESYRRRIKHGNDTWQPPECAQFAGRRQSSETTPSRFAPPPENC
ncbi:MAG: hypothetical protein NVS9B3_02510 [Gemmatimonadaceae bacterium]